MRIYKQLVSAYIAADDAEGLESVKRHVGAHAIKDVTYGDPEDGRICITLGHRLVKGTPNPTPRTVTMFDNIISCSGITVSTVYDRKAGERPTPANTSRTRIV